MMRSLYQFRLQAESIDHPLQADTNIRRGKLAGINDSPELFTGHELRSAASKRLIADLPSLGVHFDWDAKALDRFASRVIRFLEVRRR